MDWIFKLKIRSTTHIRMRWKGSKISEIGSIIFLKKLKKKAGNDLESSNKNMSKKLKKIRIVKHINIKNLSEVIWFNFFKLHIF